MHADREVYCKSVDPKSQAHVSDLQETRNNAQVNGGPAPEWMVGQGGITIGQLVLVSLKRVSLGSWVPTIRLTNDLKLVPSHETSLR